MDLNTIKEKIKKLLTMAAKGTEHEAAIAAKKAQELLMQYNLNPGDFAGGDQAMDDFNKADAELIDKMGKKIYWKANLLYQIAKNNFCKAYYSSRDGGMMLIGREHNRAICRHLYEYLTQTIDRLCQEEMKKEKANYARYREQMEHLRATCPDTIIHPEPSWRTWGDGFRSGCSDRIEQRLQEQLKAQERDGIPEAKVTALVCLEARQKENLAIQDYIKRAGLNLTTSRVTSRVGRDGYSAGRAAGNNVGMNRQMGAAGGKGRALKGC